VRVDQCSRGGAVDLSNLPCQGELAEGQAATRSIRLPAAMAHCRDLLAHPSFGLDIEAKRPRPFSPVRTSVSACQPDLRLFTVAISETLVLPVAQEFP
jgi:hypothetical protein